MLGCCGKWYRSYVVSIMSLSNITLRIITRIPGTGTVLSSDTNRWFKGNRERGAIWTEIHMNQNRRRAWVWSSSSCAILPNLVSSSDDDDDSENNATTDEENFQLCRRMKIPVGTNSIRLEFEAFRVISHELLRKRLRREDRLLDWKLVLVKCGEKDDDDVALVLARGRGEDAVIEHNDSNRRRYVVATSLTSHDGTPRDGETRSILEIWIRSRNKKDRVRLGHAAIWFDHEMKALRLSGSSERLEITKWNT